MRAPLVGNPCFRGTGIIFKSIFNVLILLIPMIFMLESKVCLGDSNFAIINVYAPFSSLSNAYLQYLGTLQIIMCETCGCNIAIVGDVGVSNHYEFGWLFESFCHGYIMSDKPLIPSDFYTFLLSTQYNVLA